MTRGTQDTSTPRTVVVSAIRLYRDSLATLLPQLGGGEVVAHASDAREAVAAVKAREVDVVVLDVVAEGPEVVGLLADADPSVAIVVIGVTGDEVELLGFVEAGACGYVTRDDSLSDLVSAIQCAARGEAVCSPRVTRALMRRLQVRAMANDDASGLAALTAREAEIVDLLGEGLSNKEIALRLYIELPTVKNHVHNILAKLGVTRRGEAAARVRRGRMRLARARST